jgi:hypothetical protein
MDTHVAEYLLREGLLLTALELHSELAEERRPCALLERYFSNPANFPEPERIDFGSEGGAAPIGAGDTSAKFSEMYDALFDSGGGTASSAAGSAASAAKASAAASGAGSAADVSKSASSGSAEEPTSGDSVRLQYELTVANEENESLRTRCRELADRVMALEKTSGPGSNTANNDNNNKNNSGNGNGGGGGNGGQSGGNDNHRNSNTGSTIAGDGGGDDAPDGSGTDEIPPEDLSLDARALHALLFRYLSAHGHKTAAVTFADSLDDPSHDLSDMRDSHLDPADPRARDGSVLLDMHHWWRTAGSGGRARRAADEKARRTDEIERESAVVRETVTRLEAELAALAVELQDTRTRAEAAEAAVDDMEAERERTRRAERLANELRAELGAAREEREVLLREVAGAQSKQHSDATEKATRTGSAGSEAAAATGSPSMAAAAAAAAADGPDATAASALAPPPGDAAGTTGDSPALPTPAARFSLSPGNAGHPITPDTDAESKGGPHGTDGDRPDGDRPDGDRSDGGDKPDAKAASAAELLARPLGVDLLLLDPLDVLARTVTAVLPHVLIPRRTLLLPSIISLAKAHPDPNIRDALVGALFNLVRHPDAAQRTAIASATSLLSRVVGAVRAETEVLPQLWEQVGHTSAARRALVAEACGGVCTRVRVYWGMDWGWKSFFFFLCFFFSS